MNQYFSLLQTLFFAIMVFFAFVFYRRDSQSHQMVLEAYKKIGELVVKFREEMHTTIKAAIKKHVEEYHR